MCTCIYMYVQVLCSDPVITDKVQMALLVL